MHTPLCTRYFISMYLMSYVSWLRDIIFPVPTLKITELKK